MDEGARTGPSPATAPINGLVTEDKMPDDPGIPHRAMNTEDVASQPPPPKKGFVRRHWGKLTLLILVTVPVLTLVIWSYAALSYSYSKGNRVGWVQKISQKGWVCKTWEGELQMSNIPGSAPILFPFTVRSDSVAHAIERSVGRQVELQYEEHPGVPLSCFGETPHFVVGVRVLDGGMIPVR